MMTDVLTQFKAHIKCYICILPGLLQYSEMLYTADFIHFAFQCAGYSGGGVGIRWSL